MGCLTVITIRDPMIIGFDALAACDGQETCRINCFSLLSLLRTNKICKIQNYSSKAVPVGCVGQWLNVGL